MNFIKMACRFIVAVLIMTLYFSCMNSESHKSGSKEIRYLPLGDSYTIGTGATEGNSWPEVLTRHLNDSGIAVEMLTNPARNGFTTNDLIRFELPELFRLQPDFVTICIGTNDWCMGRDSGEFHENLKHILDTVQSQLTVKTNIVLLTVPDFSLTKAGPTYSNGRNISAGLQSFNRIIISEATARGLKTVDIFSVSQAVKDDYELISDDDLHPSDKGYALWEKSIFPVVRSVFN